MEKSRATRKGRLIVGGLAAGLIGGVVTVIYVMQPWRTCDYDDSPAACSMLPLDFTVMMIAVTVALVGAAFAVYGLVARPAGRGRP